MQPPLDLDLVEYFSLGVSGNTAHDNEVRAQLALNHRGPEPGFRLELFSSQGDVLQAINRCSDLPLQIFSHYVHYEDGEFYGTPDGDEWQREILFKRLGDAYKQLKSEGTIAKIPFRLDAAKDWARYLTWGNSQSEMMSIIKAARHDGARSINETFSHPAAIALMRAQLGLPENTNDLTHHDRDLADSFIGRVALEIAASTLNRYFEPTNDLRNVDLVAALEAELSDYTKRFRTERGLPPEPTQSTPAEPEHNPKSQLARTHDAGFPQTPTDALNSEPNTMHRHAPKPGPLSPLRTKLGYEQ